MKVLVRGLTPAVYRGLDVLDPPWDHATDTALASAAVAWAGRLRGEPGWVRAACDLVETGRSAALAVDALARSLPISDEARPSKVGELQAGHVRQVLREPAMMEPLMRHVELRRVGCLPRLAAADAADEFRARALIGAALFTHGEAIGDLRFVNAALKVADRARRGIVKAWLKGGRRADTLLAFATLLGCQEMALANVEGRAA